MDRKNDDSTDSLRNFLEARLGEKIVVFYNSTDIAEFGNDYCNAYLNQEKNSKN